ncbi:hypothetical protein BDV93DRAFT_554242 [Ceratobasidium sp. AG-I]|nr:hypothetical protein BDV93DRAFT_554242 [Ceratobasidium sp. AG-I]
MFTVGTQSTEVVGLTDDSEAISLMLGFIYPSTMPPIVDTFELLDKSLQIAQKYHVETMLQMIDRVLSQETSYKEFVERDPLRLFQLCATYELRETQTVVARMVRAAPHGLIEPEDILKLAKQHPASAHFIGLLGAQLARENILRSVLLDLSNSPLFLQSSDACYLCCDACQKRNIDEGERSPGEFYPGWLQRWGSLVYQSLSTGAWDDNSSLFTLGVLQKLCAPNVHGPTCWACIDASRNVQSGRLFEKWAAEVKGVLKDKLDKLNVLYSL